MTKIKSDVFKPMLAGTPDRRQGLASALITRAIGFVFPPHKGNCRPDYIRIPENPADAFASPVLESGIGRVRIRAYRDALEKRAEESKWDYVS